MLVWFTFCEEIQCYHIFVYCLGRQKQSDVLYISQAIFYILNILVFCFDCRWKLELETLTWRSNIALYLLVFVCSRTSV